MLYIRKKKSLIRRILVAFLAFGAVVALALAALVFWLWQSLPQLDGRVAIAGASQPIEILRDAWGIPHIYAATPDDAYFGLGFVHAQDRMFQMEQQRRLGQGRLAEVTGPFALEFDRFLRLLDLEGAARSAAAALAPTARTALQAYAAGVNAYLASHRGALAPEFPLLLADDPAPWQPIDSLAWLKVMALQLSGDWREEALFAALTARLGPEKAASFFPTPPGSAPAIFAAGDAPAAEPAPPPRRLAAPPEASARLAQALHALLPPAGHGSNNWAVAGRHTASGRPLLANDPHLGFTLPAAWYLAHLEAPGLSLVGATLPGLPLVIVGSNGDIAWGVTNAMPDTQDLFVERRDASDPARYLTPTGSAPFVQRRERFAVRFAADREVTMLASRHGPILDGIRGEVADLAGAGEAVALAWTMLQPGDRSLEAGLALHRARNWDDFVASGRNYAGPMQNVVYADRNGNIGLMAPALVPIRRSGDGRLPAPGWNGAADWIGHIPYGELPRLLNPANGMIVTANNRPVDDDYPYRLGHRWQPGYRAGRIGELLRARSDHDLASFAAIQRDTHSGFARAMLPFALAARPASAEGRRLQAQLAGWDGGMDAALAAPVAFHAWYRELTRAIYGDDLGELFAAAWWFRPVFTLQTMADDRHGWCASDGDGDKGGRGDCATLAGRAFDLAAAALAERLGQDFHRLSWGEVHRLQLRHRLFGLIPLLDVLTGVDAPLGGSRFTVATASYRLDDEAFTARHGASLRAVIDLAEPVTGHFVVLPGQSGNPFSPYYDNMLERWLANRPLAIPFQRQRIRAAHRLILEPVPEPQAEGDAA